MDINVVESVLEGANVDNCGSKDSEVSNPCLKSPCLNNGICHSKTTEDYFCDCPTGFLGVTCETVDTCNPNPCQNNGLCHVMEDTYKCACVGGFHGGNCQERKENSNY